jgi:hypothetical protein
MPMTNEQKFDDDLDELIDSDEGQFLLHAVLALAERKDMALDFISWLSSAAGEDAGSVEQIGDCRLAVLVLVAASIEREQQQELATTEPSGEA